MPHPLHKEIVCRVWSETLDFHHILTSLGWSKILSASQACQRAVAMQRQLEGFKYHDISMISMIDVSIQFQQYLLLGLWFLLRLLAEDSQWLCRGLSRSSGKCRCLWGLRTVLQNPQSPDGEKLNWRETCRYLGISCRVNRKDGNRTIPNMYSWPWANCNSHLTRSLSRPLKDISIKGHGKRGTDSVAEGQRAQDLFSSASSEGQWKQSLIWAKAQWAPSSFEWGNIGGCHGWICP